MLQLFAAVCPISLGASERANSSSERTRHNGVQSLAHARALFLTQAKKLKGDCKYYRGATPIFTAAFRSPEWPCTPFKIGLLANILFAQRNKPPRGGAFRETVKAFELKTATKQRSHSGECGAVQLKSKYYTGRRQQTLQYVLDTFMYGIVAAVYWATIGQLEKREAHTKIAKIPQHNYEYRSSINRYPY